MRFRDVLGAVHQWLEAVKIEYNSRLEVEILEDTDTLFRVIIESENHMAELIVNEPGFAPYRFVSFQVLGIESSHDKSPLFCFYDDEFCSVTDILCSLDVILKNIVIREQFLRAAEEFGFEIIMPCCLDEKKKLYAFGYMPEYGSPNGAVIGLLDEGLEIDADVNQWCKENGYFCSFLNTEPLLGQYKRSYFRELLRDWRLSYAPNTVTLTCCHVIEEDAPILYVSHDENDGMWQFLCGAAHKESEARIVSLYSVYAKDRTVAQLANMPCGCTAMRRDADSAWVIKKG